MKLVVHCRRRRVMAVVAATIAWTATNAQAAPFRATGTDETTAIHGNKGEGVSAGVAQPGGPFTGVWSATQHGFAASGIETWDFGGGHTLTWFWAAESDKDHVSVGTFVVIGGTGRFEGATGSANYLRIGHGDGTGEFVLEGSIDFR